MSHIEWRYTYSVGIKKFDDQHKQLVKIINELFEGIQTGLGKAILRDVLNELVNYTHTHFADEEELFDLHNYPQKEEHKKEHTKLITQVQEFGERISEGDIFLDQEIGNFLKDWLINHILGEDKKYSSFFKEKGIS